MDTKTERLNPVQLPDVKEADDPARAGAAEALRAFVEPEVSSPVDVLKSTTFFQFTESGVTN